MSAARITVIAAALFALTSPTLSQDKPDTAKVDAAIVAAFPTAPAEWRPRFDQDETMKLCSAAHNAPAKSVADAIQQREKSRIEYPADGKLVGDWQSGEKIAQSGY